MFYKIFDSFFYVADLSLSDLAIIDRLEHNIQQELQQLVQTVNHLKINVFPSHV